MKILNAYAGIGANTWNWDRDKHDITHLEKNEEIADCLKDLQPEDQVIIGDAYKFIENNHDRYDFIWASPPCPTHSSIRKAGAKNGQYREKMPDFKLYSIIEFLDTFFEGDYVVENVAKTWYDPWIEPQKESRHFFWSNQVIPKVDVPTQEIHQGNIEKWQEVLGVDLSDYSFKTVEKRKVLRNCVNPKLGEKILQSRKTKQETLQVSEQ